MQQELNSSWCPGSVCSSFSSFTSNHVRIWRAKPPFQWAKEAQADTCQQCHTQLSPWVAVVLFFWWQLGSSRKSNFSTSDLQLQWAPSDKGRHCAYSSWSRTWEQFLWGKKKSSLIERYWKWTHKLLWVSGEQSTWRIWFSAASPFFFPQNHTAYNRNVVHKQF